MLIGIVLDALESLDYKKDSSILLIHEALEEGHRVWCWQQESMQANSQGIDALVTEIKRVRLEERAWYESVEKQRQALKACDLVLMRKDPPVDRNFLYTTHLLSLLEEEGVIVANCPQALRNYNEKLAILKFPTLTPPTLVSADALELRRFLKEHEDIIAKPLDGMGGDHIYRLRKEDPNINVILDSLSLQGCRLIMLQKYLPEISQGDHRILIIHGQPLAYVVARLAQAGETRANLAIGGRAEVRPLSEQQRTLALEIGRFGMQQGISLIGLDVIGDRITEINITCPTGMRQIFRQSGVNAAKQLISGFF